MILEKETDDKRITILKNFFKLLIDLDNIYF